MRVIAERAGVSVGTVNRVFNELPSVGVSLNKTTQVQRAAEAGVSRDQIRKRDYVAAHAPELLPEIAELERAIHRLREGL